MAYSIDFRERAIAFINKGHTGKELYEAFKIYPSEVNKWRKLLKETGSLKPQYSKTRVRKINLQNLKQAVEEQPDAYLYELARKFGCTKQAIFYALKRLKLTFKKNVYVCRKMPCCGDVLSHSNNLVYCFFEGQQICFC